MKISTIIPVYNTAMYIERSVESIINQNIEDSEIILIDDGSIDDSGKICDELSTRNPKIKVVHKKNGGVSSARNLGLEIAQGEYIHFADSDDFFGNNFYKTLLVRIKEDSSDLGICSSVKENKEGNFISDSLDLKATNLSKTECLVELLKSRNISYSLCDKIFKKSLIGNLRFDESISHNEDLLFCYKYIKKCDKISYTPEHFYFYCYNENSAVRRPFSHKRLSAIDVQETILTDIKQNYPNLCKIARKEFCKVILYTTSQMQAVKYYNKTDNLRMFNLLKNNLLFILMSNMSAGYKLLSIKLLLKGFKYE